MVVNAPSQQVVSHWCLKRGWWYFSGLAHICIPRLVSVIHLRVFVSVRPISLRAEGQPGDSFSDELNCSWTEQNWSDEGWEGDFIIVIGYNCKLSYWKCNSCVTLPILNQSCVTNYILLLGFAKFSQLWTPMSNFQQCSKQQQQTVTFKTRSNFSPSFYCEIWYRPE